MGVIVGAQPEIFLAIAGMLLLVLGACLKGDPARSIGGLVMIAFAVTAYMISKMSWAPRVEFAGQFIVNPFTAYMKILGSAWVDCIGCVVPTLSGTGENVAV